MKKSCFTVLLTVAMLLLVAIPAYAISYTDVQITSGTGFGGGSRDNSSDTVLSYSALSTLCDEVNTALAQGYYSGYSGYSAELFQILGSNYSYYIIQVVGSGSTCTVRDSNGMLVRTAVVENTDGDYYDYLAEIIESLDKIRLTASTIKSAVDSANSYLSNILAKIDTGFSNVNTGFSKIDQTNSWLQQMIRQLDHIDDSLYDDSFPLISKLDEIKTAIEHITISANGLTVSAYDDVTLLGKLDALKAAIDSVAAGAYDDTSLLGKLTSIDNHLSVIADNSDNSGIVDLLYQIQTSLSNLSLNIDGLESVTIDAYDDSTLLSYLTSGLNYWENIDMGIQSLNSALYYGADSELSQKLRAISTTLASINSRLVTISGYLYKSNGESLLGYLKSISESLAQLGRSGSEVPSTVLDFIIMRIVPTQDVMNNSVGVIKATTNSILTSVDTLSERVLSISDTQTAIYTVLSDMSTKNGKYLSNIYTEVSRIRASVGTGVQGQSLITLLQLVSSSLHNIETTISGLTVSSSYDDTNMIAAVNSVETALSNLSLDVGDVTVAPTDLTPVITSIDAVGVNIDDLNANFNTSLGSLVDKLDVIVDKSSESVENLTVEISVDNDAHNVFYVTDEDGNEESLVDFSGDVLKAGGKLLNFLFKVCFDGAIDNLDGSIDDMDSFYFDGAELGGSLWE